MIAEKIGTAMQQERRRLSRTTIWKAAKIIFVAGDRSLDCVVVNMNGCGACVRIDSSASPIPGELVLTLDSARTLRQCPVVWRMDERLGFEFFEQPAYAKEQHGRRQVLTAFIRPTDALPQGGDRPWRAGQALQVRGGEH
jgi:hypothetical protein